MIDKSFAVLGLGKFGESVVRELYEAGADVLAVDRNKERLQSVADFATYAVAADIEDADAVNALGLSNMDGVVIAVTENLNASILGTIYAKEAGVPYVVAKAKDETHIRILKKLGADMTVLPEYESGIRIARHLATGNILNFVELSANIRMVEISIRKEWVGHSLMELDLRRKEHINVIAIRNGDEVSTNPDPRQPLEGGCSMLITVDKKDLNRLVKE
ncbi:MAG: TrkA family potassium uptake protein [Eubacterium sp.]|nr:TrkA family potassium uptake protein [Eubacterium sp.]